MIRVLETRDDNQLIYIVQAETDGKITAHSSVKYSVQEVDVNNRSYYFVYDELMRPIEASFGFLNVFLKDKSTNTKLMYMNALKILYSFEAIIGTKLKDFTPSDVEMLKDFMLGICRPGETIVFEGLTERTPETVNQFLGVYRKYLEFRQEKNEYLSARKGVSIRNRNIATGEVNYSRGYKVKVNTAIKEEVPKYISLTDYSNIIKLIRQDYTIREECIVRLMYETGLRIGEVLGLTNEDVVSEGTDGEFHNTVYIRNRLTDKRYQLAKTVMKPSSTASYKSKAYNTHNAGYQTVYITDELYELLGKYIDEAHESSRAKYQGRYETSTVADSVCGNADNFYIFINNYGSRLSNVTWNETLLKIYRETGLEVDEKIRDNNLSHRFRHGFAMFQIQHMHRDSVELAALMRHKSIASVMKYYRPTISDKIKLKKSFTEELYSLIPELKEV